jgi:hypothetical protein
MRKASAVVCDDQARPGGGWKKTVGTKTSRFRTPTMSRQIIQALCSASSRPLPRLNSFRSLALASRPRWTPTTTFYSPVAHARKASTTTETDFDIDGDIPLPSSSKTTPPPSLSPNPYPESSLDVPTIGTDWSRSYAGLSTEPFPKEVSEILMAPIEPTDVEIKPGSYKYYYSSLLIIVCATDGLIYLPEIKYRRILNKAFGPGGWGLAPRSETNVSSKVVSREYALVCLGR